MEIVKGDNKGTQYPAIPVTPETWEHFTAAFGLGNVISIVQTFVKRACWSAYNDCIDKDSGQPNYARFLMDLSNLATTGLKLKEIREKIEEISAQQATITKKLTHALLSGQQVDMTLAKEVEALNEQYLAYRSMEEARSRKTKEVDDEPAVAVS